MYCGPCPVLILFMSFESRGGLPVLASYFSSFLDQHLDILIFGFFVILILVVSHCVLTLCFRIRVQAGNIVESQIMYLVS